MSENELLLNLKSDIEESFEHLIESENTTDEERIIFEAREYLKTHLERDYSEETLNGLRKGRELIEFIENERSDNDDAKNIALAALDYLIDPWDIIPDFVSDKGFLDDIYVFDLAIQKIKKARSKQQYNVSQENKSSDRQWVINKIGGAAGPHLAKRAKNLNILNSYQRKALFDIGRKELYGYELSVKQHAFFETLLEDIIEAGVLEFECPDSPCKYCSELEKTYKK